MSTLPQTNFRSHHGPYLNAYFGGGPQGQEIEGVPVGLLTAAMGDGVEPGPDETFGVEVLDPPEWIALRSFNGCYVCAEGGGGGLVIANREYDTPGPWETFTVFIVDDAAGIVALQTHNGQYLTAEPDGTVTATRPNTEAPGPWECWTSALRWWVVEIDGTVPPEGGNRVPAGPVRLAGRICTDDAGPFLALGASFFWTPRAWKDYRDRYDANMAWLQKSGFNFYRALVLTGGWPEPDGWAHAGAFLPWALDVLPEYLDDAFTRYNLRCSLTLFDGEHQTPTDSEQDSFVHAVCDRLLSRLHTLQDVQVANEYNPCGWDYPKGIERLRRHARTLRERLGPAIPLSISSRTTAMAGGTAQDHYDECHKLFDGLLPDIVTTTCNHDSRETTLIDGHWRHVRQGWERVVHDAQGRPLEPDASIDDEPMGPRSSVAEEDNPSLIVGKALVSYISGRHQYVYHPDAGIWSDLLNPPQRGMGEFRLIEDHPTSGLVAASFQQLMPLLPPEMTTWARTSHHIVGHPFAASFEQVGDVFTQIWPDQVTAHGVVRAFGVIDGASFLIALTGVKDRFDMQWIEALEFDVYRCGTGERVETVSSEGGGILTLRASLDTDYLVVGRWR